MRRNLYDVDDINFKFSIDETIALIKKIERDNLVEFHNENYGLGNLLFSIVGDLEQIDFENLVIKNMSKWRSVKNSLDLKTSKPLKSPPEEKNCGNASSTKIKYQCRIWLASSNKSLA